MTGHRLARGGDIDRAAPITFEFDGRTYSGFQGDTLASALLANGVRTVGRSFKYHRPRGLLGAGEEEPNGVMQIGVGPNSEPNLRATEVELYKGLVARPVNCWPSARFDLGAVNNLLARFIPAGFYYKTFMWPRWELFEPFIRRAAGLGVAPQNPDLDAYETRYAHCDVLVVGSGPAGLAAARVAARSGARVILAEQEPQLGGSLGWCEADIDDQSGRAFAVQAEAEIAQSAEATVLTRTTAVGYFDHNWVALVERLAPPGAPTTARRPRQRLWQVRAKQVILATGALERPLVFPGNDRPGVMLAQAVRRYLGRYAVRAGERAAVFTNNDDSYAVAHALLDAGAKLPVLVDARTNPLLSLCDKLARRGVEVISGGAVVATRGSPDLSGVSVRDRHGQVREFAVDLLAMSGGRNPTIHLHCQSGGRPAWDPEGGFFRPGPQVQAEFSVGAANGAFGLQAALDEGHISGCAALASAGIRPLGGTAPSVRGKRSRGGEVAAPSSWWVEAPGKAFVDFQNDVSVDDLALAARENFISVEHLKRYTTLGMATDQGKTSNVNALAIMASLTGRKVGDVGSTRYRFPYVPTELAVFAGPARGDLLRSIQETTLVDWHRAHGAKFEEYGGWRRPACYPKANETTWEAEQREAAAVRGQVGLFDGSPLGKIEVKGPDAGKFLDRIYANIMSSLKPGSVRYGLMLNELGVVVDDGVAARLSEDCFLVGTTSGGADRIAAGLEEWLQCEWRDLNVIVAPVTTAWAVLTLTGPRAREVLEGVGTDFDLATDQFLHMSFREGRVGGIAARVFRVSYTGEASYEINVPAYQAANLWSDLMRIGEPLGITPIGLDAWMLLRTEKGYVHIGADTDGATSPDDIGWGHVLKRKKDFVGRRSLTRPENLRGDRLQFVGLEALDKAIVLPIGAHVRDGRVPGRSEGYVTSSGYSPCLARGVALAMIEGGRAKTGQVVSVFIGGRPVPARIVPLCAYDPDGVRLNG